MSDEELKRLREKRLRELKEQIARNGGKVDNERRKAIEEQKNALLRIILSSDARIRLTNLKMTRPEFAAAVETQLINLFRTGVLQRTYKLPLSDEEFKGLLIKAQSGGRKRQTRIRIL